MSIKRVNNSKTVLLSGKKWFCFNFVTHNICECESKAAVYSEKKRPSYRKQNFMIIRYLFLCPIIFD